MSVVQYKQGATTVWCDGEKIIIRNPSGKRHIESNVDTLFGKGEYQKIFKDKYWEKVEPGVLNPLAKAIEINSGYIPKIVQEDLQAKSLPGIKEEDITKKDLVKDYFK